MIATPTAVAANQYTAYVHNCLRNAQCEPSFYAPVPDVASLQFYVDFGTTKPTTVEFQLIDICGDNGQQIFPSNYVIGKTPEGKWYGVFKYFAEPVGQITGFVVWLSANLTGGGQKTFFSEVMVLEPCAPLTKIKACMPEGATATGFDVNGIYYGLPQNVDYLGNPIVRYFHIAWVRLGKVRELSNKGTFKSSIYKTFRATVEKIHQLETELVPKWYKDLLLGIYARGAISVNNGPAFIVKDLNFEALNDDDLTWKPFVQLTETFRLYYGCDESQCSECCAPLFLSAGVFSEGSESGSMSESESGSGVDGIFTDEFSFEFM